MEPNDFIIPCLVGGFFISLICNIALTMLLVFAFTRHERAIVSGQPVPPLFTKRSPAPIQPKRKKPIVHDDQTLWRMEQDEKHGRTSVE